jgi:hypothetical protein
MVFKVLILLIIDCDNDYTDVAAVDHDNYEHAGQNDDDNLIMMIIITTTMTTVIIIHSIIYLFIYVLTQQAKGQLQRTHEHEMETNKYIHTNKRQD